MPACCCSLFLCTAPTAPAMCPLSLHDALPISQLAEEIKAAQGPEIEQLTEWLDQWGEPTEPAGGQDGHDMAEMDGINRKSTRLNSSHVAISYAVFCLKKKSQKTERTAHTTTPI